MVQPVPPWSGRASSSLEGVALAAQRIVSGVALTSEFRQNLRTSISRGLRRVKDELPITPVDLTPVRLGPGSAPTTVRVVGKSADLHERRGQWPSQHSQTNTQRCSSRQPTRRTWECRKRRIPRTATDTSTACCSPTRPKLAQSQCSKFLAAGRLRQERG